MLWNFILGKYIVLSDQGLSTIGLAISASLGVLTAIVVSFVLLIWQLSRKERSDSFLRWRDTLEQLDAFFSENVKSLNGMLSEISELILLSSRVSLVNPMPFEKMVEVFRKVDDRLEEEKRVETTKCKQISNYLTILETAGIEHILSHDMYLRILSLRGLFYRLLAVLMAGVFVVTVGNIWTSLEISNTANTPLAIILIGWFVYVLICLGLEIKKISRLEDEFEKRRVAQITEWHSL